MVQTGAGGIRMVIAEDQGSKELSLGKVGSRGRHLAHPFL